MCPPFARGNCIGVPGIFDLAADLRRGQGQTGRPLGGLLPAPGAGSAPGLPRPPAFSLRPPDWWGRFFVFAFICSIQQNITYRFYF